MQLRFPSALRQASAPLLYSLAIILVGLLARAAVDKLLALRGGAASVAQWAQLQSLSDMIVGAVAIGLAQGLTVLVAQQAEPLAQRRLFAQALAIAGVAALPVAAIVFVLTLAGVGGLRAEALPGGASTVLLCLASGAAGIALAMLNGYWLGRQRQGRVFAVTAVAWLPMTLAAASGGGLDRLIWTQLGVGLLFSALIWAWILRGSPRVGDASPKRRLDQIFASEGQGLVHRWFGGTAAPLWRYLPVGLSIGIASPLSQVLARGEISLALSWHDAGIMQAIWRAAEWVTAPMAGVLSLLFLPRLSRAAAAGRDAFVAALRAAALPVLAATAGLLFLLWLGQRPVLATLYEPRVAATPLAVGLFLLGEALRVGSWVILFALLAQRATWWVTIGEFLSLPLFAALLMLFSSGIDLERAGALYLVTYVVYLAFNLLGLRTTLRKAPSGIAIHQHGDAGDGRKQEATADNHLQSGPPGTPDGRVVTERKGEK